MTDHACARCGKAFRKRVSAHRFCSRRCKENNHRAGGRRPPAARKCEECGREFLAINGNHRLCTPKCREVRKHKRLRADTERWERVKARHRERYTRKPKRETRVCLSPDCDRKHVARGFCKMHYARWQRARAQDRNRDLVGCLMKRYDDRGDFIGPPTPTRVLCDVSSPLVFPRCPDCRAVMRKIPHAELDLRDCRACRIRVLLNQEEVEWLACEKRSTAAWTLTARSSEVLTMP